jgi:hypothetical protein
MRPMTDYVPWQTFDLTEGHLHITNDGRIFARFPKKWEALPRQTMPTHGVGNRDWVPYLVTEWTEYELQKVPNA